MPASAFRVTSVRANRVFSQTLGPGSWVVKQVWDLHVQKMRNDKGIVASAKEEQVMRKEGRLWWEAALHVGRLDRLEGIINEVVEKLDPVGLVGMPVVAKQRAKPEVQEEYVPYW